MWRDFDDLVEQFDRDGAVCLRGLISDQWIESIRQGIVINLASPGPHSQKLAGPQGHGAYFNDYCNWKNISQFKDFVNLSGIAEIAGRFMRSNEAVFYHEHVLVKEPDTCKATPWHHDQTYYPINGEKVCSIWIPVDPVPLATTIQFVAGSHKWGRLFYPVMFESECEYETVGKLDFEYEKIPEINEEEFEILKWEVQPGDCVIFHMKTVHGAPGNFSKSQSRRVLSLRWLGDDALMTRRHWSISPPTMGGLKPGDRAKSDVFPLVWKRES